MTQKDKTIVGETLEHLIKEHDGTEHQNIRTTNIRI